MSQRQESITRISRADVSCFTDEATDADNSTRRNGLHLAKEAAASRIAFAAMVGTLIAWPFVPTLAAPSGETKAPAFHDVSTLLARGLPIPKCPLCGPYGCRAVCQGSGTTTRCWWVCPKRL
jgi:hypothetical protein